MATVITLDGPTGAGKNTVGLLFSQKIDFQFIDTGFLYRAGALKVFEEKIDLADTEKIIKAYHTLDLRLITEGQDQQLFDGERNITEELHSDAVTKTTPIVARIPEVREVVKTILKELVSKNDSVVSGREIGSMVFPDAKLKFFLTASVEIRAKRRFNQLKDSQPDLTYETVFNDLQKRDEMDTTRSISPLVIPEGAVVIDTSDITIEDAVTEMFNNYKKVYTGK